MSTIDVVLHADYREKKVIDNLAIELDRLRCVNLDVGDFMFKVDDTPVIIIERKTTSDLIGSIIDGRFREQKERLHMTGLQICYIIELGKGDSKFLDAKKKSVFKGSLVNLVFNHKFGVLYSHSPEETGEILLNIFNKIKLGKITFGEDSLSKRELPTIKTKSKNRCENMFLSQLCLIKGISPAIGKCITEKYTSVKDLFDHWNKCDSPEELLKDIPVTPSKKLGKVLSKRIYESFT